MLRTTAGFAAIPKIRAKVLGVYGEDDARIDATLPDVERQMKAAKKPSATTSTPEPVTAS